jgi:nucleotide-binding universal stress UspA family protein
VIVKDGIVTVEGTPETVLIGHQVLAQIRHVQGVVAVRDRLVYPVPWSSSRARTSRPTDGGNDRPPRSRPVSEEVAMAGMPDGIIAGYDGSAGSDEALRWAAREACARGTVLTICLAWPPDDLALLGDPGVHDRARERGEEILARGARSLGSVLDPTDVRTVLTGGPPARVLCERSRSADMVVVGSHGHGGLAGSLLGSVSWRVASHGQGRIVVVRGRWRPVNQSPGPVVAGVDGSPESQAALVFAVEEAALRDVPMIAVCALADAPGLLGATSRMEENFSRVVTPQEKEHPEVAVLRQVVFGPPRTALLAAAAEAQMLVVGSRGLGGLDGMSLGSVAATLLQHSPCPVAVVRRPVR